MTRKEQKEELESFFIWQEDSIKHFHAAFLAHYHILNTMINGAVKCMEDNMPRVAYFLYTEYLYSLYSEMCLTTECLLKAIIESEGIAPQKTHQLHELLDVVAGINSEDAKAICSILSKHRNYLESLSKENMFVNARYMEADSGQLQDGLNALWELLNDIDTVAYEYFEAGKLLSIVYPDSMVDG